MRGLGALALRYGVAVACTGAVLLLSFPAGPLFERTRSTPFFCAVAIAAWYGGFGPALVAAVLSVLALDYFFVEPRYALNPEQPSDAAMLVAFLVVALLVSYLSQNLRAARERAEVAHAEAQSAVRGRDDFVSMVTHDLRNPLTVVKVRAELLARRGGPETREAEAIRREVNRMERLLADLSDTAQLETGQLALERSQVDLAALARESAEQTERLTGNSVQVETPTQPVEGCWDRDRLAQVLGNLLGNASKYAPGSEIRLRVEAEGERVRLSVQDDGPGIPADALPRLFERYYRVEGSEQRARGRGLGLYIARRLIEAHGGSISAASEGPGRGSTFSICLPRQPSPTETPPDSGRSEPAGGPLCREARRA